MMVFFTTTHDELKNPFPTVFPIKNHSPEVNTGKALVKVCGRNSPDAAL